MQKAIYFVFNFHASISSQFRLLFRSMSTFVLRYNPLTGQSDWVMEPDNFDFQQQIARAAFADMLHDTERNDKYEAALSLTLSEFKRRGKPSHVLDIGTGSGLLAMMAARLGATSVTAVEVFPPMCACAERVIRANGFESQIKLIRKRSTDVSVGPGADMVHRANILVTEVFDTELIGEGAIGTFNHALRDLLTEDCVVIPSVGRVFVQPVRSEFLRKFHQFSHLRLPFSTIRIPDDVVDCAGVPALHDLQLNQVSDLDPVADPAIVWRFDFNRNSPFFNSRSVTFTASKSGSVDALLVWWDLAMDPQGRVQLSCAPHWAHPERREVQWRDHWMQAVYYPRKSRRVLEGEEFILNCAHDEYSMWFGFDSKLGIMLEVHRRAERRNLRRGHRRVSSTGQIEGRNPVPGFPAVTAVRAFGQGAFHKKLGGPVLAANPVRGQASIGDCWEAVATSCFQAVELNFERPMCTCGAHILNSHSRVATLNSLQHWDSYSQMEFNFPPEETIVVCLSSFSYLPLIVAASGSYKQVVVVEPEGKQAELLERFRDSQSDHSVHYKIVSRLDELSIPPRSKVVLLGEPCFTGTVLPWHDLLHFWFRVWHFRDSLDCDSGIQIEIRPSRARLWVVPMEFENLHRIRQPVYKCSGFDLTHFGDLIERAIVTADSTVEPQPLWEYPGVALSQPALLIDVDLHTRPEGCSGSVIVSTGAISGRRMNGVALWMEYELGGKRMLSTGPMEDIQSGKRVKWSENHRQGVFLMTDAMDIERNLEIVVTLSSDDGDFVFGFR